MPIRASAARSRGSPRGSTLWGCGGARGEGHRGDGGVRDLPVCQRRRELPGRTRRDSWHILPGGGGETESVVPEDARGRGNVSGSGPLCFLRHLPSFPVPTRLPRAWCETMRGKFSSLCCRANGTEPPALLFELKLLFGDWGGGWQEPAGFAAPVRCGGGSLPGFGFAGVWVCRVGAVPPADTPMSGFVSREPLPGFVFQRW